MENSIIILVFTICGIAFLSVGIYLLRSNRRIERNGTKVRAEIIDYSKEKVEFSDEKHTVFFPILKFTNRQGIVITQKHDSGGQTKMKTDFVEIYYLKKENEYEILINDTGWKTYFPVGFIGLGTIFLVIGLYFGIENWT